MRTDQSRFLSDDICRGNSLKKSIADLIEGCKPAKEEDIEKALVGGFSWNLASCRRFARQS